MKPPALFLSSAVLLLAFHVQAQPTLSSDELLPYNSRMSWKNVSNYATVIDTTVQGANVTWNFSDIVPIDDFFADLRMTVRSPSDPLVDFVSHFPDANWILTNNDNAAQYFYARNGTSLTYLLIRH
jgi:hypothetical protein